MIFNDEMLKTNPNCARNKMGISAVSTTEFFIERSRQYNEKSKRKNNKQICNAKDRLIIICILQHCLPRKPTKTNRKTIRIKRFQ